MPHPSVTGPVSALQGKAEEDFYSKRCPSLPDQLVARHRDGADVHHVVGRFSRVGVCLDGKVGVKSYCSTFRCYLVKFVQPWIN
jgi:hypothetical protein